MSGSTDSQMNSIRNTDIGMEVSLTSQCMRLYLTSPILDIPRRGLTPFALAMPDSCKGDNAVEAYRKFYHEDKGTFATWKVRGQPEWWEEELAWTEKKDYCTMRVVKKKAHENLTDESISKVISLLRQDSPITKKEACFKN